MCWRVDGAVRSIPPPVAPNRQLVVRPLPPCSSAFSQYHPDPYNRRSSLLTVTVSLWRLTTCIDSSYVCNNHSEGHTNITSWSATSDRLGMVKCYAVVCNEFKSVTRLLRVIVRWKTGREFKTRKSTADVILEWIMKKSISATLY